MSADGSIPSGNPRVVRFGGFGEPAALVELAGSLTGGEPPVPAGGRVPRDLGLAGLVVLDPVSSRPLEVIVPFADVAAAARYGQEEGITAAVVVPATPRVGLAGRVVL